jgi:hypothetical protein
MFGRKRQVWHPRALCCRNAQTCARPVFMPSCSTALSSCAEDKVQHILRVAWYTSSSRKLSLCSVLSLKLRPRL